MSWENEKAELNARKKDLDTYDATKIRSLGEKINSNILQYVNTAGISANPNENIYYKEANKIFGTIVDKQSQYIDLLKTLNKKIKELASNGDINGSLKNMGSVRNDIVNLEKELKQVKQDADTSRARESSIENPRQKISWYQGFAARVGFTKPLHQVSIPILIGFGVLLLFMSGLLLREFFMPSVNTYSQPYESEGLFSLFKDSRFYSVVGGVVLVLIVISILTYSGHLGKNIY
jgi:hypothetical protein